MLTTDSLVIFFLRRAVNVLISRGGDGNLLYELHTIQAETQDARSPALILPLVLIGVAVISIIRYILGHTLVSLLTLQSVFIKSHPHKDRDEDTAVDTRDRPYSRYVISSLRKLSSSWGLGIFVKGIKLAIIYTCLKTILTSILTATILRSAWLQPIAEFMVTLLLAELHMSWTHATVSTGIVTWRRRFWKVNRRVWRKLVLPCAAHAGALLFLNWVSGYAEDINGDVPLRMSTIAVLRVASALTVRALVLAPTAAWLTLAEASQLPSGQQTLIYTQSKERFLTLGEILPKNFGDPWQSVSRRLCFGLLELHFKKCVLHILLEGGMIAIVHLLA